MANPSSSSNCLEHKGRVGRARWDRWSLLGCGPVAAAAVCVGCPDGASSAPDASSHADGGSDGSALETRSAELDALIAEVIAKHESVPNTGIAVAILEGGEPVLTKGYGWRDREARLPFTATTKTAIGSTTKAMTALALTMVAEEGKVDLAAPVRSYLPTFATSDPTVTEQATAIDLLAHRCGLPAHDGLWYFTPLTRTEIFARLKNLEDETGPGKGFRDGIVYNNLMYLAAGLLLEQQGGMIWERFLAERIFAPLGMTRSVTSLAERQADPDRALAYAGGHQLEEVRLDAVGPAGSVSSTAVDMAKWVALHLHDGLAADGIRLVSADGLERGYAAHSAIDTGLHYGLGWQVATFTTQKLVWHTGHTDGYSAWVSFVPEAGVGVVTLSNDHETTLDKRIVRAAYPVLLARAGQGAASIKEVTDLLDRLVADPAPFVPAPGRSLDGGALAAKFRHAAYGDLDSWTLPGGGSALSFWGEVWPVSACDAGTCTLTERFAGQDVPVPMTYEVDGGVVTALGIRLTSVPSRFARVP